MGDGTGRLTLIDVADDIMRYPPTLFIAGARDPLGLTSSTRLAHGMLVGLCETRVQVYNATHGFMAYPPQMQSFFGAPWETTSTPATRDTVKWIKGDYATVKDS